MIFITSKSSRFPNIQIRSLHFTNTCNLYFRFLPCAILYSHLIVWFFPRSLARLTAVLDLAATLPRPAASLAVMMLLSVRMLGLSRRHLVIVIARRVSALAVLLSSATAALSSAATRVCDVTVQAVTVVFVLHQQVLGQWREPPVTAVYLRRYPVLET